MKILFSIIFILGGLLASGVTIYLSWQESMWYGLLTLGLISMLSGFLGWLVLIEPKKK